MARGKLVFSIIKCSGIYLVNNGLLDDKNSKDKDVDSLASEDENIVTNMIENDISNPINRYNEIEEVYNIDSKHVTKELTSDDWMRQPRGSKRVRREALIDVFVDTEVENEGLPLEDTPVYSILYVATNRNNKYIF